MRVNYAGWPDQNGDIEVPDIPEGMVSPWWSGLAWEEREPTDVERAIAAANKRAQRVMAVDMCQARLALLGAGLLATVDAAIAAMPGAEGEAARLQWEFRQTVRRDSQLVAQLAPVLGLSDEQLDALFTQAAGL